MDNSPINTDPVPYVDGQTGYNPEPPRRSHRNAWLLGIAIAIVVLLAAGGIAYLLLGRHQATPVADTTNTTPSTPSTDQPLVPDDTQAQGTGTQYVSNGKDLNLSFSYPSDWTVTPATNSNPNDQAITVTSPLVSVTNAGGQSVTGKVIVSIRPGGTALNELAGDKATAGQASAQIGYTKPTSAQHQYPYLTYLHLAGGADPTSAFEEVMITGSASFPKDQTIPAASLGALDPVISARFYTCSDQACAVANATLLSISNSTWLNTSVCLQTLAIFQSLQIN